MDKINKTLLRIPAKQRRAILAATKQIRAGNLENLDIKKLKGSENLFRARVGSYRIILQTQPRKNPIVIDISKRNEKTYKNY